MRLCETAGPLQSIYSDVQGVAGSGGGQDEQHLGGCPHRDFCVSLTSLEEKKSNTAAGFSKTLMMQKMGK